MVITKQLIIKIFSLYRVISNTWTVDTRLEGLPRPLVDPCEVGISSSLDGSSSFILGLVITADFLPLLPVVVASGMLSV